MSNMKTIATGVGLGAAVLATLYAARLLTRSRRRKITRVIDTIPELNRRSVHMLNRARVEALVCQLIKGGKEKLQVVSDFDYTMTKSHINGKKCESSYGVIENTKYAPDVFREKMHALKDIYFPIEHDPKMTVEEKIPYMIQWWSKSNNLIAQNKFKRVDFTKMVKESEAKLRDGCNKLMELLNEHDIPFLVFSAGLGDVIDELLKQQSQVYPNTRVVSNYLAYDKEGISTGIKGDTIHVFNKNENALKNDKDYFEKLSHRTNVILMGDSVGDLTMVDGVPGLETVLRVGFLNCVIEERLQEYLNKFDIVVVDDQTMDIANGLVKKIVL